MTGRPVVLFPCVHDAGRGLAAKVLLEHHARGRVDVRSAGSQPASELNPSVVAVPAEHDLDVSREFPKPLTDEAVLPRRCGGHEGLWRQLPQVPLTSSWADDHRNRSRPGLDEHPTPKGPRP